MSTHLFSFPLITFHSPHQIVPAGTPAEGSLS
jgi:hypothetical protein